jgi:hypothetical protein
VPFHIIEIGNEKPVILGVRDVCVVLFPASIHPHLQALRFQIQHINELETTAITHRCCRRETDGSAS